MLWIFSWRCLPAREGWACPNSGTPALPPWPSGSGQHWDWEQLSLVWKSIRCFCWRSSTLMGSQVIGTQWAFEWGSDLQGCSFLSSFPHASSASWNLNFDLTHAAVSITASTHSSSASGWTLFLFSVNSKTAFSHCTFLLLITVPNKPVTLFFFTSLILVKKASQWDLNLTWITVGKKS